MTSDLNCPSENRFKETLKELLDRLMESDFPRVATIILQVHADEVWIIEWSDGLDMLSASKDKSPIGIGIPTSSVRSRA
jgi:hypothetical protein